MGPWLADTIRQCDGMVDIMSYWTFSDVFEEQGPVKQPFYGGYGLIAAGDIPKPAFDAFALLHRLGDERLALTNTDALATRRKDGTLVIALWNLVEPDATGPDKAFHLDIRGISPQAAVTISRVDARHGDTLAAYKRMGSPRYPTPGADQGAAAGGRDRRARHREIRPGRLDGHRSSERAGADRGPLNAESSRDESAHFFLPAPGDEHSVHGHGCEEAADHSDLHREPVDGRIRFKVRMRV